VTRRSTAFVIVDDSRERNRIMPQSGRFSRPLAIAVWAGLIGATQIDPGR
jgi:hypothetical protein